ncbi:ABC transporter ATP-binding protein [Nocardioides sp. LMS-CY]|uniref:ABC transporter ATP-binding protein n=1 Tax=Nocardioides sp. (strain LMS-CY) TaxID=2840457 RepID=UPI001C00889A|nr:ABC transporter ATP-binding protein [Nocardioides sp. LMS-CY]QWF22954.1 ABC transporter ATP-binding protein [Nocardioides sp. LMS-CY]
MASRPEVAAVAATAEGGTAISLRGLAKRYGRTQALDDVSLEIEPGQFVTLLGPSGSGKTTLLQAIAGFVDPDAGSVLAGGMDITTLPAHRREIGLVFQHYALFPHLTVEQNIAYSLRVRGTAKQHRHELVQRFLDMVEMSDLGSRMPDELSGGQRQRVALARALVFEPKVVLLDEALSALDRKLRQSLQFTIKRIQRDIGATFIHVTHDQDEALAMSDVIVLMRAGSIEQVGTPADLYDHPVSPFAAAFMGEANLVEVTRVEGDALEHPGSRQRFGASHRLVPVPDVGAFEPLLCVRPEAIRLTADGGRDCLTGVLTAGVFMGDHWRYNVDIGTQSLVIKDFSSRTAQVEVGQQVQLELPRYDVPLFVPADPNRARVGVST